MFKFEVTIINSDVAVSPLHADENQAFIRMRNRLETFLRIKRIAVTVPCSAITNGPVVE